MALSYANIDREEREVDLKNKPLELVNLSPKATVPVLVLENGQIIDESIDIMKWALRQSDPDHWFSTEWENEADRLIYLNDRQFKPILDNYKYSSRAEIKEPHYYRGQAEKYLAHLNSSLLKHSYLLSNHITFLDIALFPFIRQFYMVDEQWFRASEYRALLNWLNYFLESPLFHRVMIKKTKFT